MQMHNQQIPKRLYAQTQFVRIYESDW